MTQDPYGQRPATGNVVRGEVIPDNEGHGGHGGRTDPAIPDGTTDGADPDRTAGPEENVVAVRSPDADDRDNWEATDTQDPTPPQKTAEPDADAADAADDAPRAGESDSALAGSGDVTSGSLVPDAAGFRTRWQQVQFRFVDDPLGSVTEAADVISQLTAKLEEAIAERQRALRERWGEDSTDTESLRGTLLMYRAFLDQLIGPDGR